MSEIKIQDKVKLNRSLGEENGDQIKMFLIYNLIENHNRAYSSLIIPVDNSSLINITHLVSIKINRNKINNYI